MKEHNNYQQTLFPYLSSFRSRLIFILACCFALNINTVGNFYALDDEMVIGGNANVHLGFAGLGKIFSTDAYRGFFDYMDATSPLAGGRYRPLSIATFAIEEQIFGEPMGNEYLLAKKNYRNASSAGTSLEEVEAATLKKNEINEQIRQETIRLAPIRHFMQVVYFMLTVFVLFLLLDRYLLKDNRDAAFVATLIFAFHPIHTEVIANVKSRDEIFSLLFILLTCIYALRYHEDNKNRTLFAMSGFALAALFSKEYAVIIPVIVLCAVAISTKEDIKRLLTGTWFIVLCILSALFMLLRYALVIRHSKAPEIIDPLNDPYLYADFQQKIATKIATLIEYVKLLIWPHPLSSDYSYSHFPYLTFTDPKVWVSILFWTAVIFVTVKLWKQKHVLSFALIFFLAFFMLINNMLFAIGATMGERLIFHSSIGFCMIAGWSIIWAIQKIGPDHKSKVILVAALMLIVCIPMGYKTIARNVDWKNDYTLFTRDVKYISNSALTNGNAGAEIYNQAVRDIKEKQQPDHQDSLVFLENVRLAKVYLSKSLAIHPRYVNTYLNRALCYMSLSQTDSAIADWKLAAKYFKGRYSVLEAHAKTVLSIGRELGSQKDYINAARFLRDASEIDPGNPEIWNNLGGSEFMQGNFAAAAYAFRRALSLNVNIEDAKRGAAVSEQLVALENKAHQDSLNPAVWMELSKAYENVGFPRLSQHAVQRAAVLK